jgi:subtilisin family serine protease
MNNVSQVFRQSKWLLLIAAAAILGSLVFFGEGQAIQSSEELTDIEQPSGTFEENEAVTLITGDVIHLSQTKDGTESVMFEPGPGREGIGYVERRDEGQISVIPSDALALVAKGDLDRRLFNLKLLARLGYTDREQEHVPVIVQYEAETMPNTLEVSGVSTTQELSGVEAVALELKKAEAVTVWEALLQDTNINKIWLDGKLETTLAESIPQIGAEEAWDSELTGAGVTVGVIDSGIDTKHEDLVERVVGVKNFTDGPDGDDVGHGTHVASTIAGSGAVSEEKYVGVAPDADLLDAKVCIEGQCPESLILAGMDWVVEQGADVVNVSLGTEEASDGNSLLEQAIDNHTADSDVLFVVSAGNFSEVGSPGAAESALTVGAVDKSDQLAEFSGQGPRRGDYMVKPEIVAPGVSIMAAMPGNEYGLMSGTSMSSPHVAGAAAIISQQRPEWSAAEIKSALSSSAELLEDPHVFAQGSGRLDVDKAVNQTVIGMPSTLNAFMPYPEGGSDTHVLTYSNTGDTEITLDLRAELNNDDGESMPEGAVQFDPEVVNVPAGDTAQATVTFNTEALDHTLFGGHIIAEGEETRVNTSVSVYNEPESYDITIRGIDRRGGETSLGLVMTNLNSGDQVEFFYEDGAYHARPPAGHYSITTVITTWEGIFPVDMTLASEPSLELDNDIELTFDARNGVEPSIEPPSSNLTEASPPWIGLMERIEDQEMLTGIRGGDIPIYAIPDARVGASEDRDYTFMLINSLYEPAKKWEPKEYSQAFDPKVYNLAFADRYGIPDNLDYAVNESELARVDTQYGSPGISDGFGVAQNSVVLKEFPLYSVATDFEIAVPGNRTVYFSTDLMNWHGQMTMWVDWINMQLIYETGEVEQYQEGEVYSKIWNSPALGPSASVVHEADSPLRVYTVAADTGQWGHEQLNPPWTERGITGDLVLSQEGEVIGSSDSVMYGEFEVPNERAEYTLDLQATRNTDWSEYATEVDAQWTFSTESEEEWNELPLLNVNVDGEFDALGRAPKNKRFPLNIRIERQVPEVAVTELKVEYSYNEGETWHRAPVTRNRGGGVATVIHPAHPDAEFVSLRIMAEDAAGNKVKQTVLRVYGLEK